MGRLLHSVSHLIEHLTMREWLVVLAVSALLGPLLLRGFGSRKSH